MALVLPLLLASAVLVVTAPGPTAPGPSVPGAGAHGPTAAGLPVGTSTAAGPSTGAAASWNGSRSAWRSPIDPPELLAPFAPPTRRWLPGHRGVDLAAGLGQPVRAAGGGTVTWAGELAGRGVVVVTHDGGLRTTYEPVDPAVAEGDRVEAGQVLGTVGEGDVHCGHQPRCLHWGLRRGEDYLDPWRLLHPGRAVLLPP